jgi:hypothetical protein
MVAGKNAAWSGNTDAMKQDTSKRVTRAQEAEEYLRREDDGVLETMLRHNMALTRDAYIFANWGHKPEPLTAEEEEQVPDIFREKEESTPAPALPDPPATTPKKPLPCLIIYQGIWVSVPLSLVEAFLDCFRQSTPEEAAAVAQIVQRALDELLLPKLKSSTMSPQEYREWEEKISMWHAYEVLQGRASLQKH